MKFSYIEVEYIWSFTFFKNKKKNLAFFFEKQIKLVKIKQT